MNTATWNALKTIAAMPEPERLEAGPELDARVAVEVMGWAKPPPMTNRRAEETNREQAARRGANLCSCFMVEWKPGCWWAEVDWGNVDRCGTHDLPVTWETREFSSELSEAWGLVEHLRPSWPGFRLEAVHPEDAERTPEPGGPVLWQAEFGRWTDDGAERIVIIATAATPELAIVGASLETLR